MVFVCHVILQDHVTKALNDFMVMSPSSYVTTIPSLWRYGAKYSRMDQLKLKFEGIWPHF